jgi:hypothetical protein
VPVLSHIVRTRLSGEFEDVATEALAYILRVSEGARSGMMKLLRGIHPGLPDLDFVTQRVGDGGRPDLCGMHRDRVYVYSEHKFWAGLTDQQPLQYLHTLGASVGQDGALLFIGPEARVTSLWDELMRRTRTANVAVHDVAPAAGVLRSARTDVGPHLALTTWRRLLGVLRLEVANDSEVLADIDQLHALCESVDRFGWQPFQAEALSNQATPAMLTQIRDVVDEVARMGVTRGALSIDGLKAVRTTDLLGRYAVLTQARAGVFIGLHLPYWREHGATPMWLTCSGTTWGRGAEYGPKVRPWATAIDMPFISDGPKGFGLGLRLLVGTDLEEVSESVLAQLLDAERAMLT